MITLRDELARVSKCIGSRIASCSGKGTFECSVSETPLVAVGLAVTDLAGTPHRAFPMLRRPSSGSRVMAAWDWMVDELLDHGGALILTLAWLDQADVLQRLS